MRNSLRSSRSQRWGSCLTTPAMWSSSLRTLTINSPPGSSWITTPSPTP
uniref:Macaca fascicularis brain cDNA clone: QflA-22709, similar to human integrin, beta 2 (antigen CD18 (p95), lymphocytefunction-associated antigen 1; macrophage antigen 1(mac-1) beta subunit) (ITGB2),... n=1 Tax=Macaca fascicularis TaxID=9541 RepID=I7GIU6_MACFA|nr:unnamed protein product [Macaca fascicularis]